MSDGNFWEIFLYLKRRMQERNAYFSGLSTWLCEDEVFGIAVTILLKWRNQPRDKIWYSDNDPAGKWKESEFLMTAMNL